MPAGSRVSSQMVEFHRFGEPAQLLMKGGRFIRTTGWDGLATEIASPIGHRELVKSLNLLRYSRAARPSEVEKARTELASEAAVFLPQVEAPADHLFQIDLVTNAGELWAFPFEACFATEPGWLAGPDCGVELTRRIRGVFVDQRTDWPDRPRILFLHAPKADDLPQSLIDAHVAALNEALAPWSKGKDAQVSGHLKVRPVWSGGEVRQAMSEAWDTKQAISKDEPRETATYVHVLAHGVPMRPDPLLPEEVHWGLRLGITEGETVDPVAIAEALAPDEGRPLVVTLATCDSGNQADPAFGVGSLLQELHRRGVPVVVGAQLPLTQVGSPVLARSFYTRLCRGEDARIALHAARVDLRAAAQAWHDWLSLVGYVRLPEGYAEHLLRVGLKAELGMLNALQARMDVVLKDQGPIDTLDDIESRVRSRLESLEGRCRDVGGRRDLLDECCGLQASACKRLAELRFLRGQLAPGSRDADRAESRRVLGESLRRYRAAYDANIHSHWNGVQQLALEAALDGKLEDPDAWKMVRRAAALARDAPPAEGHPRDYWSGGTLVELFLLGPVAGRDPEPERTREAVQSFRERVDAARDAGDGGADFALQSTRRQLSRYVTWWTKANGFFPGREKDLAEDARAALKLLE